MLNNAIDDVVPAAPAPDVGNRGEGKSGDDVIGEQYMENLLNGGSSGSGGGSSGSGGGGSGGSGQDFGIEVLDDSVMVTRGNRTWMLSEGDLESIMAGDTALPQPLENAIGAQGATVEEFAEKALMLLD